MNKPKTYKFPKNRTNHDQYLESLIYHIDLIGEDKSEIEWIMKDGFWQRERGSRQECGLCDLIVGYYEGAGIPIELKGSPKRIRKARNQIERGRDFLEDVFNLEVPYGKVVIYSPEGYHFRKYYFEDKHWEVWNFAPFI